MSIIVFIYLIKYFDSVCLNNGNDTIWLHICHNFLKSYLLIKFVYGSSNISQQLLDLWIKHEWKILKITY